MGFLMNTWGKRDAGVVTVLVIYFEIIRKGTFEMKSDEICCYGFYICGSVHYKSILL